MEQLKAVILAAGKGTRMKSDLPKVVHTIEGKCLVDYAIEAAIGAGADAITEGKTKPKPLHTESTLLAAMDPEPTTWHQSAF